MATNCDFECYSDPPTPDGRVGKKTGTISLADVVVNTTPTTTGGWNTATITADLAPRHFVGTSAAATAGIDSGWYEKVGLALFRKVH